MSVAQLGFDIGSGALKIAQCDGGSAKRAVVRTLPDNLVREGHIVSLEAMADFIKETLREERLPGKSCAVVLPAGTAFLRRITMPAMTVDQLTVNLPFEFRDYLTASKDKYFYDYAVNSLNPGEDGLPREMDLTAAAVAKETIGTYTEMFRRAGLRLKAAAPAECAYANILRTNQARLPGEEQQEFCILDLGHGATRVYIYTGSCFEATRVIEIGGATVDAAVAEAMSVDEHVARGYKEANHASAQELESARGVYTAIAVEVMKAINFYGFNNRESNLRHLYLCGGGGCVPTMRAAVAAAVELEMHSIAELLPHTLSSAQDAEFCAAAAGITMQ